MRVLFVSSLPSRYSEKNSSYMYRLVALKEELERQGVHTDMLYLGDLPINRPPILFPISLIRNIKFLESFDIIHTGGTAAAYAIAIIKKICGWSQKPIIVYDIHGETISENSIMYTGIKRIVLTLQAKIMDTIARRYSDIFVSSSISLRKYYVQHGKVPENRIFYLFNVANELFFKKNGQNIESPITNSILVMGYAGGFQKWQGIDLLITALEKMKEENKLKGMQVIFIGFDKSSNIVKESITRTLGGTVQCINRVNRHILREYLQKCDVLIIPRDKNLATDLALPTKLTEYMALGKAILSTRVKEVEYWIKVGKCGIVSEPTSDGLKKTISALLDNPEKTKLKKYGKHGQKIANKYFKKPIIGQQYYKILKSVLRDRNE